LKRLAIFLLLALPLSATVRTVKAGGGGDCTVIQTCVNLMSAGDTTTVFAGTYNEVVTLASHPGTAGNYVTLQVNTGDTVTVYGFIMASHTKVIGFHITSATPTSNLCVSFPNITDVYFTNNVMYACGSGTYAVSTGSGSTGSDHIYFQGNTLSYSCSTSGAPNTCKGIFVVGSYQLFENNDISHVADGGTIFANHIVWRNNTMHDFLATECGTNSGNCHIDFLESEPGPPSDPPSAYNLYEGNTLLRNIGGNAHGWLTQGDACGGGNTCSHTIERFNVGAHIGTNTNGDSCTGVLDDNAQSGSGTNGYTYVKTYNDTWAYCQDTTNQATDYFSYGSAYGSAVNNIYYAIGNVSSYNAYAAYNGGQTGFSAHNNLGYCTGTCTWSTPFSSDSGTLINQNPNFVNAAADNYALQASSPARQAGSYLTTAVSCVGTALTVADASYFFDGAAGIVNADWVRIGPSTTAQVSSINYGTNVITLTSSPTCSNGDGVYLYKKSDGVQVLNNTNPDMGAIPYVSAGGTNSPTITPIVL
jgi:hypothetical protein